MAHETTYTLKRIETKDPAAKYHYRVTDEDGKVISEYKSNTKYVACTANGWFHFEKLEQISGEYTTKYVRFRERNRLKPLPIAYLNSSKGGSNV